MNAVRLLLSTLVYAVLVILTGALAPAHAGEIAPNPNPSGNTITVSSSDNVGEYFTNNGAINIDPGGTLTVKNWQRLDSYGTLTNSGTLTADPVNSSLWNFGTLTNGSSGTLNNNARNLWNFGTMTNSGAVNNRSSLGSYGTLANYGTLTNYTGAELANYGTMMNYGTLTNYDWLVNIGGATLANYGTLTSSGWLVNAPYGTMMNHGMLTTSGTFFNYLHGVLNNSGTFSTSGCIHNWGILTNSSVLTNSGTLDNYDLGVLINTSGATLTNNGALTNWAGAVFVNSGTFANNGTFTNSGTFVNSGTLTGTGTIIGNITNSGIVAPGNLVGTMTIAGNYTHNASAVYQVEVNGTGQSDRLVVTGTAALNGGSVSLQTRSGVYYMNTAYTILSAGNVVGTFGSVTGGLMFLTPSLTYDPTHVYLLLTRNSTSFADVALTENERAVASALDRVSAGSTGDMYTVINNLLSLSTPSEARDAYDQMGGLIHTALPGAVFSSFNRYLMAMTDRMAGFTSGGPSMSAGAPFMLASRSLTGSDAGNTLLAAALSGISGREKPLNGLWVRAYGGIGSRRGSDISSRYDSDLAGIAAGFDREVTPSLLIGASLGYSHTKVTMKDLSDTGRVSSYQGSLYGAYRTGPWYVNGIAAYGYNRYDTSRDISFGDLSRTANADYSGHALGGYLEAGRRIVTSFTDIIPMASLRGTCLMRDAFIERDADALNLDAGSDRASSLVGSLGVRVSRGYPLLSGTFTPEVRVRWDHEFMNDDYTLNARFAGSALSAFTVRTDRPDKDSLALGLTLAWQAKESMHLYLAYDGSFSGDDTQHGGSLGVRFRW